MKKKLNYVPIKKHGDIAIATQRTKNKPGDGTRPRGSKGGGSGFNTGTISIGGGS